MAMKWCTKLEAALKRCPIVFQGYPSNFKVTRDKTLSILTRIECFRTVTPVWIHQWLWNDAQNLKQHRKGALLFFKIICQISRSERDKKIADFDPNWAFPDCNSSLTASNWPIKFQVHTGQNIVNLDPNLACPDCNFSLNSPLDLKWFPKLDIV